MSMFFSSYVYMIIEAVAYNLNLLLNECQNQNSRIWSANAIS